MVNDPHYVETAEILREKGTDRGRFLRGEVQQYTWKEVGSSFLLSEFQAAFLLAKLERRQRVQSRRRKLWRRYAEELRPWARRTGAVLPSVSPHVEPAYHLFHLILPDSEMRPRCIQHLAERGAEAAFHHLPLHLSAMAGGLEAVGETIR